MNDKQQRIEEVKREWSLGCVFTGDGQEETLAMCATKHVEALDKQSSELAALRDKVAELSLRCLNVRDALNKYHRSKLQSDEDELDRVARGVNSSDLLEPLTAIANERDALRTQLAKLVRAVKYLNGHLVTCECSQCATILESKTLLAGPAADAGKGAA